MIDMVKCMCEHDNCVTESDGCHGYYHYLPVLLKMTSGCYGYLSMVIMVSHLYDQGREVDPMVTYWWLPWLPA